jgi:hypothetical protein
MHGWPPQLAEQIPDVCRQALTVAERFADEEAAAAELLLLQAEDLPARADEIIRCRAALGAPRRDLADLVRDIFGDPFRPVSVDPSWLTWADGTVPRLAEAVYQERTFTPDRLGILADAIEEAGAGPEMPGHLRSPGPHALGCHVVDALRARPCGGPGRGPAACACRRLPARSARSSSLAAARYRLPPTTTFPPSDYRKCPSGLASLARLRGPCETARFAVM